HGFLLVGVMAALWLTQPERHPAVRRPGVDPPWARWVLIALGATLLLPNLSYPAWNTSVDTPPFFADGLFRTRLPAGATILVIPYADRWNSLLWQAETGFAFRMAEGYVSVVPPPEFSRWPILKTLYTGELVPAAETELRAFLRA